MWAALLHAQSSWYFLAGGLWLWLYDRALRWIRGAGFQPIAPTAVAATGCRVTAISYGLPAGSTAAVSASDAVSGERDASGGCPLRRLLPGGCCADGSGCSGGQLGQHVYLQVPEISSWEWHPFSLANRAGSDRKQLYCMAIGQSGSLSFTDRLHTRVAAGLPVSLRLDGPYGQHPLGLPAAAQHYRRLLLVAGGIGATASIGALRTLIAEAADRLRGGGGGGGVQLSAVKLLWVGRSPALFAALGTEAFDELAALRQLQAQAGGGGGGRDSVFECELHCSQLGLTDWAATQTVSSGGGFPAVQPGRPDLEAAVRSFVGLPGAALEEAAAVDAVLSWTDGAAAATDAAGRTLLSVCGPAGLSRRCGELAAKHGIHFHSENFAV